MASTEWENERLYVLETVNEVKKDTKQISESMSEFKLEVSKSLAIIQTKLALYSLLGSSVMSTAVALLVQALEK